MSKILIKRRGNYAVSNYIFLLILHFIVIVKTCWLWITMFHRIVLKITINSLTSRSFSTSAINNGIRNFNKFRLIYRGTEYEKKIQKETPDRSDPNWGEFLSLMIFVLNAKYELRTNLLSFFSQGSQASWLLDWK